MWMKNSNGEGAITKLNTVFGVATQDLRDKIHIVTIKAVKRGTRERQDHNQEVQFNKLDRLQKEARQIIRVTRMANEINRMVFVTQKVDSTTNSVSMFTEMGHLLTRMVMHLTKKDTMNTVATTTKTISIADLE